MSTASFFQQIHVYFWKTVRIANREKFWKSLIFSAIISFLVMAIVGPDMFRTYNATKSGFFTISSACIWIGIFNTIQSVCKEHEIIHADARAGMNLGSYVLANALWQLILCLMEAIIIYLVSTIFIDYAGGRHDPLIFGYGFEFFFTMYLLLFGSACLGLMVSSVANNGTMAMVIMPFVLILQLIFCGVLFDLKGASAAVGFITLSKWGMSAFGCISDMCHMDFNLPGDMGDTIADANRDLEDINRMGLGKHFDPIEIHPEREAVYRNEAEVLAGAWFWLVLLTAVSIVGTIVILKLRNKES